MTKIRSKLAVVNADQIEYQAIIKGRCPYGDSTNDDSIAKDRYHIIEEIGTPPPLGSPLEPDHFAIDVAEENAESDVRDELVRRRNLLKEHYPFELRRTNLEYRGDKSSGAGIYEFCLAFSITQNNITQRPFIEANRAFENLVGELLCAFWGKRCNFYRFGATVDGGKSGKLSERLGELKRLTSGEFDFKPPRNPDTDLPIHPEQGDGGIDVVVWKSVGDGRRGTPMILSQCACGEWENKRSDLHPGKFNQIWGGVISLGDVHLRSMAIPHHVAHESDWHMSVAEAGLFLDRIRLTLIGEVHLNESEKGLTRDALRKWTDLLNSPLSKSERPRAARTIKPSRTGKRGSRSRSK